MQNLISLDAAIDIVAREGENNPGLYVEQLHSFTEHSLLRLYMWRMSSVTANILSLDEEPHFSHMDTQSFVRGSWLGAAVLRHRAGALIEPVLMQDILPKKLQPANESQRAIQVMTNDGFDRLPNKLRALALDWSDHLAAPMAPKGDPRQAYIARIGLGISWYYVEQTERDSYWLSQAVSQFETTGVAQDWDAALRGLQPPETE